MDKEALIKEYDLWLTKGYVSAIVIIIMVAVVLKTKVVVVQPENPHYYTDVADWAQDVKDHITDSELRHTFVASTFAAMSDNVITDKEYKTIKDSYQALKQANALSSIHDNIKFMRPPNEFSLIEAAQTSNKTTN